MRVFAWFSIVVSVALAIFTVGFITVWGYQLNRDIEAVAHRAQVAADAEDMLQYMKTMKANMERHGMATGYTALIFKQPSNDLSLLYASVNNIINRLEQVKNLPKSETAYQVALDDLRGTIRELESPSSGFVWVNSWFLPFLAVVIWIWPLIHYFHNDFDY